MIGMPLPVPGSEAHDALKANAEKPVSTLSKMFKREKRKPPTKAAAEDGSAAAGVVPGKLITRENDMYVMSIGMMLGLRVSLYYNAGNVDEDVTEEDMISGDHYVFPPEGSSKPGLPQTPKHHLSHTFKMKDYAPKVFHRLRMLAGVDTRTYIESVSGDANFIQFTANSKSGQFFFFTNDGNFMIKTVTHEEVAEMQKILPQYYRFLKDNVKPHLEPREFDRFS